MRSKMLFVIFFTIAFFALRFPEYNTPLLGEDGIFADLFINAPKGPLYGQTARINGVEIYSYLSHPAPLYELLNWSGKFFTSILPLKEYAVSNDKNLAASLRFSFSFFQFFSWGILLAYLLTLPKNTLRWHDLFFFFLLTVSPPAIMHSMWLQTDNASGSILIGLLMGGVLLWERFSKKWTLPKLGTVLFVAGLISAMGKNEWSFLMFLAILATGGFVYLKKYLAKVDTKQDLNYLIFILAGLIAGNVLSYFYDTVNYMGGIGLLNHMSKSSSVLNTNQLGSWFAVTKARMPFLYLSLGLWLYMTSMFVVRSLWKITTPIIFSFFVSSAFLWSFFLSSWDTGDRYFIPAFIALVFTLMLVKSTMRLPLDKFMAYVLLFLSLDVIIYQRALWHNHDIRERNYPNYVRSLPSKEGCIHFISYYAFNLKNIDYVGLGNGEENLKAHMHTSGLELCN